MFGLFQTPDIAHPQLGVMKWKRGCWHGTLTLPAYGSVPLAVGGSRKGPDAMALAITTRDPQPASYKFKRERDLLVLTDGEGEGKQFF